MILINECFLNLGSFQRPLILKRFLIWREKDQLRCETDFNIENFANFRCESTIDSSNAEFSLKLSIKFLDFCKAILAGTRLA